MDHACARVLLLGPLLVVQQRASNCRLAILLESSTFSTLAFIEHEYLVSQHSLDQLEIVDR